jgi:hypothetical protein
MTKHFRLGILLLCAAGPLLVLASRATGSWRGETGPLRGANRRVTASARPRPLHFEEDLGQSAGAGRFFSRGRGYALALDSRGASLTLVPSATGSRRTGSAAGRPASTRLELQGSNPKARIVGLDRQRGVVNYLVGRDPKKWRTHIPTYKKVKYEAVYPGVDLVYHGDQGSLEYDFIVRPGADPNQIRLSATGADDVELADNGDLLLHLPGGTLTQKKPVAYQLVGGKKHDVPAAFRLNARTTGHVDAELSFVLARYDPNQPLIIDPILGFSTYLGGNDYDETNAVACGSDWSVYVAGATASSDFILSAGPADETYNGNLDAVVTRLTFDGQLIYSTYLGGTAYDGAKTIAVDGSGAAYVAGATQSVDFPTLAPTASTGGGGTDGWVAKLTADGTALGWSTYLGGTGWDSVEAIAHDGAGSLHVCGITRSTDFPTQNEVYDDLGDDDGFAALIAADGSSLLYSTYLGGAGPDVAVGLTIGPDGGTYVVGGTASSDFPATGGVAFPTYADGGDAFLTKLAWNGSTLSLAYSTYLGGSSEDGAYSVAVGWDGSAYVAGVTASTDFPTAPAGAALFGSPRGGSYDGFVSKVAPTGDSLSYSTFLGGGGEDGATSIAVDSFGEAYVTGYTTSDDFPVSRALFDTRQGGYDAFVTHIKPNASGLDYSTYLGGAGEEYFARLALQAGDNPVVVGSTTDTFPLAYAIDSTTEGGGEGFVAWLIDPPDAPTSLVAAESAGHYPLLSWSGAERADSVTAERKLPGDPDSAWAPAFTTSDPGVGEDTTAVRGIEYNYRVRAFSRHGNSGYTSSVTYTPAPPASPSGVTAGFAVGGDAVWISWSDNSDDELAFLLQRQDAFGSWSDLVTMGPDATSAIDPNVQPWLVYGYRVVALNQGGASAPSDAGLSAPPAPFDLRAAAQSASRITLSWSTNARNQHGAEIEARRGAGPWERIAVLGWDELSYEHTDLLPNTTYTYHARNFLRNSGDTVYSGWSDPASAVTVSDRPEAPGSFQAFSPDRGRVVLTWMDNADDEAGFKVYRRIGSSGAFTLLDTVAADANTFTDATTTGDTQYSYTVAAYNDRGASPAAKEQTVTTLWGPESLTGAAVTTAQVNLTWKDMSLYEDGYSIERRKGAGVYVEAARVSGKVGKSQTLTYNDTGLTTGVSYTYRVRAYNTRATSLYANGTSITTTGAPEPGLRVSPVAKSYGRVPKGQTRTATFTVKNTGRKWEAVTIPALGGAFQVIGSRRFTLSAGESRSFRVRFSAGRIGAYRAELPVKCQHGEVVKLELDARSIRG